MDVNQLALFGYGLTGLAFTFLFLFFPSGLVLYWFVNNLLSIAQQWVITRKIVGKIQ